MNDPDFWVVFLEATEKTQMPFLRRAVDSSFLAPKIKNEAELKAHLARMIHAATSEGDRNLEKATVTNLLAELRDALNRNASIIALLDDYKIHLQYHSKQNKFYYEDAGTNTFCDDANFKTKFIEEKVAQLSIDINSVKQTISYLDKVSFEYLPLLPTGTCILAGLLANVPIVIDIGKIEPSKHEPRNKTITLTDKWK